MFLVSAFLKDHEGSGTRISICVPCPHGDSNFDIRHAFTAGLTYSLPSQGPDRVVRAILGGWSLDGLALARSPPPDDVVVGPLFQGNGIALIPRPNLNPGVPLELFGSGYPGGKIFNKRTFTPAPNGQQGNFGATCCAASVPRKPILGCSGSFASLKKWVCACGASFSTF